MLKIPILLLPSLWLMPCLEAVNKPFAEVCEVSSSGRRRQVVLSDHFMEYTVASLPSTNPTNLLKSSWKEPLPPRLTLSFRLQEGAQSSLYRKRQLYKNLTAAILKKAIAQKIHEKMGGLQLTEKYVALYLYSQKQKRFFPIPGGRSEEKLSFWDKKYRNRERLKNYRYEILYFPALQNCALI